MPAINTQASVNFSGRPVVPDLTLLEKDFLVGAECRRGGCPYRRSRQGFAVLAQEVRELARRSAGAAKDSKGLITTSNDQVRKGVQLVGDTGTALTTIVADVQEINRYMAAVVESEQEQASGLKQINTAVNQMAGILINASLPRASRSQLNEGRFGLRAK